MCMILRRKVAKEGSIAPHGQLTLLQLANKGIPRLPALSEEARRSVSEPRIYYKVPHKVVDETTEFRGYLTDFRQQLQSIDPNTAFEQVQLGLDPDDEGFADTEGGMFEWFMPVFRKVQQVANSGVLAPVPTGGKYFCNFLPGTAAIKVSIENAVQGSSGGSVSAADPWQAEQLLQAAKAAEAAATADRQPAPTARQVDDLVLVFKQANTKQRLILMLGELKLRQKLQLVCSGEAINLAKGFLEKDESVTAIMAQMLAYMEGLCLRYAFLTCHNFTWLVRREASSPTVLRISEAIDCSHDASVDPSRPTLMLALLWLLNKAVTEPIGDYVLLMRNAGPTVASGAGGGSSKSSQECSLSLRDNAPRHTKRAEISNTINNLGSAQVSSSAWQQHGSTSTDATAVAQGC
eukprot:jgi/Chrzof1/14479/Cz09g04100.t1